jgi:hypothetical protein
VEGDQEGVRLTEEERQKKRFNHTLRAFFQKYDKNGDGVIDRYELRLLFNDLNEVLSDEKFEQLIREMDTDNSGVIEFKEFAVTMQDFVKRRAEFQSGVSGTRSVPENVSIQAEPGKLAHEEAGGKEEEDEEEEEEVPEDIAELPAEQQRFRILLRASWMMGLGTLVVLLFSDPMVDVLSELGERIDIPAFYVSFVLAPIASNASELIASINYAAKKSKKSITISLVALEGAASMNNTFCLGVFLALIFFRSLVWEFTAETVAIIVVEIGLFFYTMKKTHTPLDALIILSFYPISLCIVALLESAKIADLN